jgi:Rieske Fe-S protein
MNHIIKTSLIAALSTVAVAGSLFAATTLAPASALVDTSSSQTVDALQAPAASADQGIQVAEMKWMNTDDMKTWAGEGVIIVNINGINNDTTRLWFKDLSDTQITAVQDSIKANPALLAKLTASNVQIDNIVAIYAMDESNVQVFVR